MLEFRTQGFNGYAVKYSTFFDSRIAVATAANFGLVGNGRLYILDLTPKGIVAEKWFVVKHDGEQGVLIHQTGSTLKMHYTISRGPNCTKIKS